MTRINCYIVKDDLRDVTLYSLVDAHEVYAPFMAYSTFTKMIKKGRFPHLTVKLVKKEIEVQQNGTRVLDVESGHIWESITDAAFYLRVSRQAVIKAAKTGGRCRGRIVQFA